jgi:predicted signal transduction protein with EAL and GGDEF domain
LGSDEFAVIINDEQSADAVPIVTQKIIDSFKKPFDISDSEVLIGASIGISVNRLSIRSDLSTALENNEFHLVFQPIVDSVGGEVVSSEALLRWIHPEKGMISTGYIYTDRGGHRLYRRDRFMGIGQRSDATVPMAEARLYVIESICEFINKANTNGA